MEQFNENNSPQKNNTLIIVISILITAVIVGLGIYLWQNQLNKKIQNSLKSEIYNINKQLSSSKTATQELQNQISELQGQLETSKNKNLTATKADQEINNFDFIQSCDFFYLNKKRTIPESVDLRKVGLGSLLDEGYEIEDICQNEIGLISFIGAKMISEKPDDENRICGEHNFICDKDVFGLIDLAKKINIITKSKHILNIFSEFEKKNCYIDKVVSNSTDYSDAKILFYGGYPGRGSIEVWYYYDVNTDNLTLAQQILPDRSYDIKSESLLKLFSYKTKEEIPMYKK